MSARKPTTGVLIREARAALNLTREQFAAALRISVRTLAEYETEAAPVRPVVLQAIENQLRRMRLTKEADKFQDQCEGR